MRAGKIYTATGRWTSADGTGSTTAFRQAVNHPNPMRIAVIQSCYIPWKGFFDLLGRCDEYVIFDSVQYVKGHWHNRNRIKTADGVTWLTIPVLTKGRYDQPIDQVEIEKPWADKHWRALDLAYKRAPFFEQLAPAVRGVVRESRQAGAADRCECDLSARHRRPVWAQDPHRPGIRLIRPAGAKTQRLLGIARAAGANRYFSGPSARAYFDEALFHFKSVDITPEWMN